MPRRIDWESQIGRRLRLRDLYVFSSVVRLGSMGKAAQELGVSQPAVSEVIADLEHGLGVRLLDRGPQGVSATVYGVALERRSVAAFDELKQGIKDIEFLSDPTAGEIRIGCPESISAAILQPIIEKFSRQHPAAVLDIDTVNTLSFAKKLRDRELDLVLARGGWPLESPELVTDFNVETLCDDELVVVVGQKSPWARRRKVDIAELHAERWILTSWGSLELSGHLTRIRATRARHAEDRDEDNFGPSARQQRGDRTLYYDVPALSPRSLCGAVWT